MVNWVGINCKMAAINSTRTNGPLAGYYDRQSVSTAGPNVKGTWEKISSISNWNMWNILNFTSSYILYLEIKSDINT